MKLGTDADNKKIPFQRLLMEVTTDLVFVKDTEFRIVDANQAFLNLYPPEIRDKVIGYTTVESYSHHDAELFLKEDRRALKEGFAEIEEAIVFPNGANRTMLTKKQCFEDEHGQKFILGISRDITDRKKMELDLLEANDELQEFSYRTSHDLRAPLISSVKLLKISQSLIEQNESHEAIEYLTHAQESLSKLETLVTDILQLSRVSQAELPLTKVSLEALCNESISKLAYMEGMDRLSINLQCGDETVITQKELLSIIIENLLSNAIKYQDPEQATPTVNITASSTPTHCILRISDNGLGIPAEYSKDIYAMFKRFHPKTAYGSGLGLYMVKKNIAKIGASISYTAKQPGTEFSIYLPHKTNTENA